MPAPSRQRAQGFAQFPRAANQLLDLGMCLFPDRIGFGQQRTSGQRQSKTPATPVLLVDGDFQETASRERFEVGRDCGSVHGEKGSDASECRRLRPVERHQQRKLTVRQLERPQHVVKTTRQCARRAMHVQAEAIVSHQMGGGERQLFISPARV